MGTDDNQMSFSPFSFFPFVVFAPSVSANSYCTKSPGDVKETSYLIFFFEKEKPSSLCLRHRYNVVNIAKLSIEVS